MNYEWELFIHLQFIAIIGIGVYRKFLRYWLTSVTRRILAIKLFTARWKMFISFLTHSLSAGNHKYPSIIADQEHLPRGELLAL